MKNVIGFCANQDQEALPEVRTPAEARPIPSVAEVFFPHNGRTLSYYNDRFDLRENDVVFVSGKLAKSAGVRVVTYRIEGGYLTQPRWSTGTRRGKLFGRLIHVYEPAELKAAEQVFCF